MLPLLCVYTGWKCGIMSQALLERHMKYSVITNTVKAQG